jgi:hypothetical protein
MAVFITDPPDFKYSGLYFPQIWQALIVYRRAFMPDLTDENPNEPTIQVLKAFGGGFHYGNVLLDHVALETLFTTARLRESLKAHLSLIAYRLKEALAASATLLCRIGAPTIADATIPAESAFATEDTEEDPEIRYETLTDTILVRTDRPTYGFELKQVGEVWSDVTAEMQGLAGSHVLFDGSPEAGDALYIGHDSVIIEGGRLDVSADGDLLGDPDNYVLEYYDQSIDDTIPTAVVQVGQNLRFDITTLLGANNRAGAVVTVKYLLTGAEETAESYYTGVPTPINQVQVGLLGQEAPVSTFSGDYLVGVHWKEFPDIETAGIAPEEHLKWTLPEDGSRSWVKTEVNGVEAYWHRLRMVQAAAPAPTVELYDIAVERQYAKLEVSQGEAFVDDPAGTFDGTVSQAFITTQENVIEGSLVVYVDEGAGEVEYTLVDDFLSSNANSRHYTLAFDADGRAVTTFGNGSNGFLPAPGAIAKFEYRIGGEVDGNVGADEITFIKDAPSFIVEATNPRPAVGWAPPEASTDDSVAEVKVLGPASLRIRGRAITTTDMEELAESFVFENGSRLISRAKAIVDGFGEKTIKLLIVGQGGLHLSPANLAELDLAFNGDAAAGIPGMLVAGLELTSVNYVKKIIDVEIDVLGGDEETVQAALAAYLTADRRRTDGTFEYEFQDVVYTFNIKKAAADADEDVVTVTSLTTPALNVALDIDELPYPGTIVVNVTDP